MTARSWPTRCTFTTTIPDNSAVRATAYAAPTNVAGGSVGYALTRMYAGPGATIQFNALITANDNSAQCVPGFSGYLLNAQ